MAGLITDNIPLVIGRLKGKARRVDNALEKSVDQAARQGVGMARKLVRKKTGALSASIDKHTTGKWKREIRVGKWYGIIIEKGRKEVRPVNKKALFWKGLPHPVMYAKAYKGQPFMEPTERYLKTYVPIVVRRNVAAALRG